jgi:hypothetical protein
MPRSTESQARPMRGVIGVLPYLADIVVPLVSFYVLRAAGLSTFWSLVAGGALTTVISAVNTFRRGKLDAVGALVIAEIVLSIILTLLTHSSRLLLARGSLYLAVAGAWVLVSAFTRRPLSEYYARPFAERRGRDAAAAFDWLVANSAAFLRIHRITSVVWGVLFLVYAAVRLVIVFSVSVSTAVWTTEIPGIAAIAIGVLASRWAGKRTEALVDARLAQEPPPAGPEPGQA